MESDLQHQHHIFHDQQQKQMNSGLTRYQSAPSSYFSSFQDKDFLEDFLNRPTSPETERIFTRILSNTNTNTDNNNNTMSAQNFGAATPPIKQENLFTEQQQPQVMADQTRLHQQQQQPPQQQQQQQSYSSGFNYQSQSKPPLPDHNSSSGMDYRMNNSMGMERLSQLKPSGGNNSGLLRHNSSPAGLFSNINIDMENGFAVIRGMGDYGTGNRDASYSAVSRPPPSSGRMSPISEIGNKNMGENNPDSSGFSETQNNDYVSGFPLGSWEETALMTAGSKRLTEDDRSNSLNASENQSQVNGDVANRPPMLAHHLSLPKTAAEFSAIEKYLQLTDSVPCHIRAKRGCATHPRSIAERVRRTRISERMRKLQDLVPNMDKQTNTSDMLDLAVDYIKDLQKQVKTLSDTRSRCTCSGKPSPLQQ